MSLLRQKEEYFNPIPQQIPDLAAALRPPRGPGVASGGKQADHRTWKTFGSNASSSFHAFEGMLFDDVPYVFSFHFLR